MEHFDVPTCNWLFCNAEIMIDDLHNHVHASKEKQVMANVTIPVQMAPDNLYQPILPGWQLSLFSVNLGDSSDPEMEKSVIQRVGSYGKQIGHLAEALEVVIEQLKLLDSDLAPEKKDALKVFLGDVAAARGVKHSKSASAPRKSATSA